MSHSAGFYDHGADAKYFEAITADPQHRWTREEQVRTSVEWGDPVGKPGQKFNVFGHRLCFAGRYRRKMPNPPASRYQKRRVVCSNSISLDLSRRGGKSQRALLPAHCRARGSSLGSRKEPTGAVHSISTAVEVWSCRRAILRPFLPLCSVVIRQTRNASNHAVEGVARAFGHVSVGAFRGERRWPNLLLARRLLGHLRLLFAEHRKGGGGGHDQCDRRAAG